MQACGQWPRCFPNAGVSGVPVVDAANRVIGIVSEGDLLHRAEIGTERPRKRRASWGLNSLGSDGAPD